MTASYSLPRLVCDPVMMSPVLSGWSAHPRVFRRQFGCSTDVLSSPMQGEYSARLPTANQNVKYEQCEGILISGGSVTDLQFKLINNLTVS